MNGARRWNVEGRDWNVIYIEREGMERNGMVKCIVYCIKVYYIIVGLTTTEK